MFSWLREKVKNAVLAGINDAVEVLQQQAKGIPDDQERLLTERVLVIEDKPKRTR